MKKLETGFLLVGKVKRQYGMILRKKQRNTRPRNRTDFGSRARLWSPGGLRSNGGPNFLWAFSWGGDPKGSIGVSVMGYSWRRFGIFSMSNKKKRGQLANLKRYLVQVVLFATRLLIAFFSSLIHACMFSLKLNRFGKMRDWVVD